MSRGAKGGAGASQLRIIGGQWRGRKLRFTPAEGLRPTGDRVRETLFNWLAADVHGARCLDLFAGSGALGLEALSRGAAHCDFVDTAAPALRDISGHLTTLEATDRALCHRQPATEFLAHTAGPWDIVFLDPPFGAGLLATALEMLETGSCLQPGALIYIETGKQEKVPPLPAAWDVYREKHAGEVSYRLFVVRSGQTG